jgi:hypothetical protein
MKIDKKLLEAIKTFKKVGSILTIEDIVKSIKLLKGIDIKK